eukprot:TRINITY_DN5811_c0_g1_i4.p2 TRINITY_DN5811_c0_g1~~TRINITY_DN5811_c0_g1_i4.p2  ORF type:complete len:232 (-),score=15.53 TRINITY_DN5811_c0_g1_i4:678-1304(-)
MSASALVDGSLTWHRCTTQLAWIRLGTVTAVCDHCQPLGDFRCAYMASKGLRLVFQTLKSQRHTRSQTFPALRAVIRRELDAMDHKTIVALALLFCLGVLLQFLGCVLYANWWPMLTVFFYVLIPMPYVFFGGGSMDNFYSSDMELGWVEAGKFMTGFSAVGLVAVPAILAHADKITVGAMLIELCAAAAIGAMVAVYDYATTDSSMY